MSDSQNDSRKDYSVANLLIRLPVGILLLFAGLNKFIGGYGNFVGWMIKDMSEKTWLPGFLLYPFTYTLPFIEVALGALLVVGLFTRPVLILSGLLLISLMFGKILTQDYPTVASTANYVFMVAVAYFFSKYNLYSLDHYWCKK